MSIFKHNHRDRGELLFSCIAGHASTPAVLYGGCNESPDWDKTFYSARDHLCALLSARFPAHQAERTELFQPGMADTTSFLYKKDALWDNVKPQGDSCCSCFFLAGDCGENMETVCGGCGICCAGGNPYYTARQ